MDIPTVFGFPELPETYHKLSGFHTRNLLSPSSGGQKAKIKVPTGPRPQLPMVSRLAAASLQCSRGIVCVCVSVCLCPKFPFSQGHHWARGPGYSLMFILTNSICSDPISKQGHTLKHWA